MSGVSRVSIPNSVKMIIENIKEIAGNHSDEEIYATLKECSMDPNETTHKLLFQDTFHEVKRKRDRKKEGNRETSDTKWRQASQGRGSRGGRGNYSPHFSSHDSDTRRNIGFGKENGISEGGGKGSTFVSSLLFPATENKAASGDSTLAIPVSSSMPSVRKEPIKAECLPSDKLSFSVGTLNEERSAVIDTKGGPSSIDGKYILSNNIQSSPSISVVSASGVFASSSKPDLLPSREHAQGTVVAIKHETGIHQSKADTAADRFVSHHTDGSELPFLQKTVAPEKCHTFVNGEVQENSHENEGFQIHSISQAASPCSSVSGTSGSRPSSNYNNRSQRPSASLKAVPAKEWKPKSTTANPPTVPGIHSTSGVDFHIGKAVNPSVLPNGTKLQKKLGELVIIPDHLLVSESERSGLSFGSFDYNFSLSVKVKNEPDSDENSREPSESKEITETTEDLPLITVDSAKVIEENNYQGDQQPSLPENQSVEIDIPSSISPAPESDHSKSESSLASASEVLQLSVVHTAPVYSNFGLVSPMLGSHFAALENADPQTHETARVRNFIVPQPFDPSTNYYASIYRPAIDGDGRFSPLLASSTASKYHGTVAMISAQTGQSSQESENSLALPLSVSTSSVPQAAGVVQTPIAVGQQSVPVFRQPAGVHISHYPPNYVHYSQYFSPFYVPPPAAIHHYLGNAAAFPQQPPPGSMFPLQTATAGTNPAKYPISQYKPSANSGPTGQGPYSLNPVVYGPVVSCGNATGSEDLASSQFKTNNMFMTGQQSEGSAVWMPPPARDISSFQTGSFYSVPPQVQSIAFTQTQAGHAAAAAAAAAFPGIYHPAQAVPSGPVHPLLQQSHGDAADMYQQQQQLRGSPISWINNY